MTAESHAGAATAGRDRQLNALHELMQHDRRLTADELKDPNLDLARFLMP